MCVFYPREPFDLAVSSILSSYVVPPGDVVGRRVGLDVALEVDVVALLDVLRVQAGPEVQDRRRHV